MCTILFYLSNSIFRNKNHVLSQQQRIKISLSKSKLSRVRSKFFLLLNSGIFFFIVRLYDLSKIEFPFVHDKILSDRKIYAFIVTSFSLFFQTRSTVFCVDPFKAVGLCFLRIERTFKIEVSKWCVLSLTV